jgi:hypothetical protein
MEHETQEQIVDDVYFQSVDSNALNLSAPLDTRTTFLTWRLLYAPRSLASAKAANKTVMIAKDFMVYFKHSVTDLLSFVI